MGVGVVVLATESGQSCKPAREIAPEITRKSKQDNQNGTRMDVLSFAYLPEPVILHPKHKNAGGGGGTSRPWKQETLNPKQFAANSGALRKAFGGS